ncbi:lipopolysaccharide assembly protein [Leeuwenhoekiella aestuarii]|uniref:Lipopolysaccharide assembly protein n=2 Tax=Leeuwenhoekiella TaxID=283735 RepID=A0A4Q0NQP3_9FLAO|nr:MULTISPECIES: LptE family protein [Leeuwenhoekiella]RXG11805.1 lipopolysaccharide assembly protein [Leeuwenhoekiella polynyae]RXG12686.1 lipopolysaccharide assembly protein [Leeuwenhoekiella aestuarii]RXG14633.1 lipopolysaccharide assembly protein [Leeuwenhoekiella aestuarii]|tara:strand:+ start:476 stop:991 length:516 start_codon:yes stop_codon:yes gene_type:complete
MKKLQIVLLFFSFICFNSCGFYSFTGADIGSAESYYVSYFQNNAPIVEPGIDRRFTFALSDLIQNQTSLNLATNAANADLIYEGEIVDYYIAPQTATSDNVAAQNRITIVILCRFTNKTITDGSADFEKRFSFFVDIAGTAQPVGAVLDGAIEEIYERITQDIFQESLANW